MCTCTFFASMPYMHVDQPENLHIIPYSEKFWWTKFGEFAKNKFWRLIFWRLDAKADRHTHNRFILVVKS